ncbi:TM2 domain-containing protein [Latilactobacillus sp. 5-91]|uniref:TM2 domain-containing protein n=1 Tax=Latilactobacillus sp. 5-91 TaxID=3410924 RepID=UPI003C7193EF
MSKIIKIDNEKQKVMIGNEDNSVSEVTLDSLDFEPAIGDLVDVFNSETETIVTKKEAPVKETSNADGININIVNDNNNSGTNTLYAAGKVVNKLVYILLALFLGGLGVHKFLAGKIGTGILYIIFCWTGIPSIIGLIEAIIAMFKTADSNGNIIV